MTHLDAVRVGAILMAAVSWGCEGTVGFITTVPFGPSHGPTVAVAINFAPTAPASGGLVCADRFAAFDLVVTASQNVELEGVTIQMSDGSHLGGPSITFPKAELASQFGATTVAKGTTRSFTFRPQFPCGSHVGHSLVADMTFFDPEGRSQRVTANHPWP